MTVRCCPQPAKHQANSKSPSLVVAVPDLKVFFSFRALTLRGNSALMEDSSSPFATHSRLLLRIVAFRSALSPFALRTKRLHAGATFAERKATMRPADLPHVSNEIYRVPASVGSRLTSPTLAGRRNEKTALLTQLNAIPNHIAATT